MRSREKGAYLFVNSENGISQHHSISCVNRDVREGKGKHVLSLALSRSSSAVFLRTNHAEAMI
jgi:hypothetical protein